jgi:hypothetical protein
MEIGSGPNKIKGHLHKREQKQPCTCNTLLALTSMFFSGDLSLKSDTEGNFRDRSPILKWME